MSVETIQSPWNMKETHQSPVRRLLGANNGKIATACIVAFAAIGALIAGGVLFHLNVNALTMWSVLGGGGGLGMSALIGGAVLGATLYKRYHREMSYHVVSWNIGLWKDHTNMLAIHELMTNQNCTLAGAYEMLMKKPPPRATDEVKEARFKLLKEAFEGFGNPDIICLQETEEIKNEEWEKFLPPGYQSISYTERDGKNGKCAIVWNTSKFSLLQYANIDYGDVIPEGFEIKKPDTLIELKDKANGTTLCVGSTHTSGFSLAYHQLQEGDLQQLEITKAEKGDKQTSHNLNTMDLAKADLNIFGGDFNAARALYPKRFTLIEDQGYVIDSAETRTIYDANVKKKDGKTPKALRLDHMCAKGNDKLKVRIENVALQQHTLHNFKRASDHLPISSRITCKRA